MIYAEVANESGGNYETHAKEARGLAPNSTKQRAELLLGHSQSLELPPLQEGRLELIHRQSHWTKCNQCRGYFGY